MQFTFEVDPGAATSSSSGNGLGGANITNGSGTKKGVLKKKFTQSHASPSFHVPSSTATNSKGLHPTPLLYDGTDAGAETDMEMTDIELDVPMDVDVSPAMPQRVLDGASFNTSFGSTNPTPNGTSNGTSNGTTSGGSGSTRLRFPSPLSISLSQLYRSLGALFAP